MLRGFLGIILTVMIAVTAACMNRTASYMRRGWRFMSACEEAATDVKIDIQEITAVIWEKIDTRPKVTVYPMVNANISWNCLNKK